MRKYITLFICIFLLSGCHKEEEIKTIIKNSNSYISINYPITNIKKLDNEIDTYINKTYNDFNALYNNKEIPELNISYTYKKLNNRYISIALNTFVNNGINKENTIATFNYDTQNKNFFNLNEITKKKNIDFLLKNKVSQSFQNCNINCLNNLKINNFILDDKNITIFFNTEDLNMIGSDIVSIKIPNTSIHLNSKEKEMEKVKIKKNKKININNKVVALTFDDGPSKHTAKILKILEKENAKATFFVVGNKLDFYRETMIKMVNNGNEIGNHSFSHKLLTRLSTNEFKEDIEKTQETIFETTGYTAKLIRPTYGGYNDKLMSNVDLKLTLWDVDASDWRYKSENRIVKNVLSTVEEGDIILMHDTFARTANSVEKIIKELKKEGYTFVTVSELNKIKEKRNR